MIEKKIQAVRYDKAIVGFGGEPTFWWMRFLKKGFGSAYLEGIKEGLQNKDKIKKVDFKRKNLKNYFKLEYKLIINTIKFLKK